MEQFGNLNNAMRSEDHLKSGASLKNLMIKGRIILILFLFGASVCNAQMNAKYDKKFAYSEGIAIVQIGDKFGYIDEAEKEITPVKYDATGAFKEGMAKVKLNDKWGFIDKTGKEITPVKYDSETDFEEGVARAKINEKIGFINKAGKEITSFKYDKANAFKDGIAIVVLNDKRGCIDKTGKEIIPVKYDQINQFQNGIARVTLNEKLGYIDKTGKEITPCKYDKADNFSDDTDIAFVKIGDKYGIVSRNGEITPPKYDNITTISKGIVVVKQNEKYGFIDETGKEIITSDEVWVKDIPIDNTNTGTKPYIFEKISNFINDFQKLTLSVINTKGDKSGFNAIVGQLYDYDTEKSTKGWVSIFYEFGTEDLHANQFDFLDFESGKILANVVGKEEDYRRYVNWVKLFLDSTINKSSILEKSPRLVAHLKYDDISTWWSDGLASVKLNNKYGYIDKTGKEVIPLKYDGVDVLFNSFEEGLVRVELNGKYGFIDKTGKEVIPLKYDFVGDTFDSFREGLARVELNGKYGFIDKTGKEVIPLQYDNIYDDYFKNGFAKVKLGNEEFYIDKNGNKTDKK